MLSRFALAGLFSIAAVYALDLARGDQFSPSTLPGEAFTSCRVGVGGMRCTHFEGYVVVRRRENAPPRSAPQPDAVLSANRLYLPVGDDKTP